MPKGYKLDLTGQTFGRLTVLEKMPSDKNLSRWKCVCSCGKEHILIGSHLTRVSHPTQSCGCLAIERTKECKTTHGQTGSPEFTAWINMMDRCYNPKRANYSEYGGRGIFVSEEWHGQDGVMRFLKDLGPRPSPQHSLERLCVNENYGPTNCKWATKR